MIEQTYSIKDLEDISGIKTHTLRAWERRYQIFSPGRTATNIRYYSDDDLKKLLNISILLDYGMKISHAATLGTEDLTEKVRSLATPNDYDSVINRLIIDMIEFDQHSFDNHLNKVIFNLGFEDAVYQVIYPFFRKVGILWLASSINPAQEHFVSNIIKQKLFMSIYSLDPAPRNAKSFILFLPKNEAHELGLLVAHYLILKSGFRVIYLGQDTPMIDVVKTWNATQADYLFTHFTSLTEENDLLNYLIELSENVNGTTILASGLQLKSKTDSPLKNVIYLNSPPELTQLLKNI